MSRAQKYIVTRGGVDPRIAAVAAAIAVMSPILWFRNRETSGTTPVNSGSLAGLTVAWTAGVGPPIGAIGQPGAMGPADAYFYNALESKIQINNNATLAAMGNQAWAFLIKPSSIGEGNLGHLFSWGAGAGGANQHYFCFNTTNRLSMSFDTDTTSSNSVTNNNQISDVIGASTFSWLCGDFDNTDSLGNGRVGRFFKIVNGVVSQLTLATNTAATGTITTQANPLALGNNTAAGFTIAGYLDEVVTLDNQLWTAPMLASLAPVTTIAA